MNSKFSILLCFIFSMRLFPFTNSASLGSSMLDEFIAAFNVNKCKMPEQIVLQNIAKYNVNSADSVEENPYDLAVPLAVCAAKVPAEKNRDAELCSEVFEILTNISTCMLNNTVLQKIENINITFENEVCDGFSKNKNIFLKDEQFVASKLANEKLCTLYCNGGEIFDACKFLLWSYRVQATIYDQLKDWQDSNTPSPEIDKPAGSDEKENSALHPAEVGENAHINSMSEVDNTKQSGNINIIDAKSGTDETALKIQSPSSGTNQSDGKSEKSQIGTTKSVDISSLNLINTAISNNSTKTAIKDSKNMEKQTNLLRSTLTDMSKESTSGKSTLNKQVTATHSSPLQNVIIQKKKPPSVDLALVEQTGNEEQSKNPATSPQGKATSKSDQSHNAQEKKLQGVDPSLAKQSENGEQNENSATYPQGKATSKSDQLPTSQEPQDVDPITKDKKNYAKIIDNGKTTFNISKTTKTLASKMDDNDSAIKKATSMTNFADDKKKTSDSLEKSTHEDSSNQKSTISLNNSQEDSLKSTHLVGNNNGDTKVKPAGETDKEGATKLNTSLEDGQAQLEEMEDGGDDDPANFIDDGSIDDNLDGFVPKSDPGSDTQQEHDSIPEKINEQHTIADEIEQSQDSLQMNGIKPFPEQEDTHFFFYFLSIILVIIGSYLVFHNKQKIIALIIEGRHEKKRRSHNIGYKKLETK